MAAATAVSCGRTPTAPPRSGRSTARDWSPGPVSVSIRARHGTRSAAATSMATARPTFSGRTLTAGARLSAGANVVFNPGTDWHGPGTGDFNGDGKADILWQNANGQAAVWEMDGLNLISGSNVGFNPGPAWQVHGTGDFNGDGK